MTYKIVFMLILILILGWAVYVRNISTKQNAPAPTAIPTPTFTTYKQPDMPKKAKYLIVMVGDSMTLALGPHGGSLNTKLNDKYGPQKQFVDIDNYARASTSILSFPDVWNTPTKSFDVTFPPLKSSDFDLILVESFGYNPLSQYQQGDDGLIHQNAALDALMATIINSHRDARVAFVATIAPNKERYASPVAPNDSVVNRTKEATERMRYILNHINYAHAHNIPVIDIFNKTLTPSGDGNLLYINPDDYIHPSATGVDFIGQTIANFIWDNNILPH